MRFIKINDPETNCEDAAWINIDEIVCIMPGQGGRGSEIYFKNTNHVCARKSPNELMDEITHWRNNNP